MLWTSMALDQFGSPSSTLECFCSDSMPMGRKVEDILDDNRSSLPVCKADFTPLALVNKVGAPCGEFPTFLTYPGSYAFQAQGPGMVLDANTCTYEEPNADEHERAMRFPTRSMASHDLIEDQRCLFLGQAINSTSLVWYLGIRLAFQRHMNDQLMALGAEHNG